MDIFDSGNPFGCGRVDLDDLATYPEAWLTMSTYTLWRKAWLKAGESLFYSQYIGLYKPVCSDPAQELRVGKLCNELAMMWRDKIIEDTPDNRLKLMKWICRFEDETENQC